MPDEEVPQLSPEEQAERDKLQLNLLEVAQDWHDHWKGMPDFKQADLKPKQSILVHFKNDEDRHAFSKLLGQTITDATKFVWYPKAEIGRYADKRFKTEETVLPRHPIYIVSKGRYEKRLTSDSLRASRSRTDRTITGWNSKSTSRRRSKKRLDKSSIRIL